MEKKNVLPMNEVLVEADALLVEMQKIIQKNRKTPNIKTGVELIWNWYGFIHKSISLSPEMEKRYKLIEGFLLAKETPVWTLYLENLNELQSKLFQLSFLLKLRIEARSYLHGLLIQAIDRGDFLKSAEIVEKLKNLS